MGSADGQLSQAELSCAVGISSSFLSLLEQGRTDIAIDRLLHLTGFYDVEFTDLPVATLEGHSGGARWRSRPTAGYSPAAASAGKCGCGILPTAELVATLEAQSSGMTSVAFSPGELLLASAAVDGTVRLWDIRKRARSPSLESGWLSWRWPGAPAASPLEPLPGGRRSARCHRALSGTRGTLEILRSITSARAPRPADSRARSDASLVACRFPPLSSHVLRRPQPRLGCRCRDIDGHSSAINAR